MNIIKNLFTRTCYRPGLALLIALLALPVQQAALASTPEAIDAIVFEEMRRQNIPGLALGIVKNNRLYYAMGYGYEDPEQTIPVTTRSIFRWSSVSKTLTATAALKLAEENPAFSLEDRVIKHVGYWPRTGNKADIRIKHLLSNRSGIIHYTNKEGCYQNRSPDYDRRQHPARMYNARQAVEVFKAQNLCFEPGTSYKYSTFGFSLLGSAIEGAAGMSYVDWVDQKIRIPLGMSSLRQGTGVRGGYYNNQGRIEYLEQGNGAWRLPGSGWESNIVDMAKFANALLHGKLLNNTARLATSVPGNDTYGYGMFHKDYISHAWHKGNNLNSSALLYLYPRSHEKLGLVVMANNRDGEPIDIVNRLASVLLE
jgi:CubicO group peptidase (beta-lactamase class C family)